MPLATARKAEQGKPKWRYQRRRPEQTLLYQLVERCYPDWLDLLASQRRLLPKYVPREFDDFLEVRALGTRISPCQMPRLSC